MYINAHVEFGSCFTHESFNIIKLSVVYSRRNHFTSKTYMNIKHYSQYMENFRSAGLQEPYKTFCKTSLDDFGSFA
uniref:Uncharacterized protein n=1 Tax=Glossina palpalis gambiensis TaxID=67801 RepID=A0A1B0AVY9_9MUSC